MRKVIHFHCLFEVIKLSLRLIWVSSLPSFNTIKKKVCWCFIYCSKQTLLGETWGPHTPCFNHGSSTLSRVVFWAVQFLVVENSVTYRRVFRSTLGLLPLDASSIASCNYQKYLDVIAKCLQRGGFTGEESPLFESHCLSLRFTVHFRWYK